MLFRSLAHMVDLCADIGVVIVNILARGGKGAVGVLHLDPAAVGEAELLVVAAGDFRCCSCWSGIFNNDV